MLHVYRFIYLLLMIGLIVCAIPAVIFLCLAEYLEQVVWERYKKWL